jgi:predicted ATPase
MLIRRLVLKKLLSFNSTTVELQPLNVLIGPNAVGKSNLIECLSLLHAAPIGMEGEILRGGGIRQWLWLGDKGPPIASIECELTLERGPELGPLRYELQFSEDSRGFIILEEQLAKDGKDGQVYFERRSGVKFGQQAVEIAGASGENTAIPIPVRASVLSAFKNPADLTPITEVGKHFEAIRIFREFQTGPASQARFGISTTAPKQFLSEGGDNLAMVLHELDFRGVLDRVNQYLRRFCERFEAVKPSVGEGLAKTFLREAGLSEVLSATRMSDGTLKFLCLLAVLFHPMPPPLVCIEEPELGLHPDAMRLIAEVLVEASERMQLIVTTHSEALVDALSDRPEAVLVCERDFENGTECKRLSRDGLDEWLAKYTLGELWRKGEIGGGRW